MIFYHYLLIIAINYFCGPKITNTLFYHTPFLFFCHVSHFPQTIFMLPKIWFICAIYRPLIWFISTLPKLQRTSSYTPCACFCCHIYHWLETISNPEKSWMLCCWYLQIIVTDYLFTPKIKKHLVLTHLESSVSVTYPPTNQYLCALKTVNDFSVDTYKLFIRFIDLLSISKTTDYDTHPQKRFCDPNMTNILWFNTSHLILL